MVDRSDVIYQLVYRELQRLAGSKKTATYKEIGHLVGFDTDNRAEMVTLGEILHEINRQEHDTERPLLSALVTRGNGGLPGEGFFESAHRLRVFEGLGYAERKAFWLAEKQRVHDYWSKASRKATEKIRSASIIKVIVPAKGSSGLYATIGLWRSSENRIEIAFPGKKVHLAASNKRGSKYYHPALFSILKGLLEENGRWQRKERPVR